MKKIILCMLMLCLVSYASLHAAPVQTKPIHWLPAFMQPLQSAPEAITVASSQTGLPVTIYAVKSYENYNNVGGGLYVDVYIRFYEDADLSIPYYVSGLTINYYINGFNGTSNYTLNRTASASGEYIVLEYQNEYDYDDGTTQRYRDYHLSAGDYVPYD